MTPMQMAVMNSAIANGGKVFWPRLVDRIEPQDPAGEAATNFPSGVVRDQIDVHPAELANFARSDARRKPRTCEGTGKAAVVDRKCNLRQDRHGASAGQPNHNIGQNFWFASFAPYENPKYAVVVMVEWRRGSGGMVCAPIAHDIYEDDFEKGKRAARKKSGAAN